MSNYIVLIYTLLLIGKTIKCTPHIPNQETNGCKLPPQPDNGYWIFKNGKGEPGDTVPPNSILEFQCNDDYFLSKSPYVICLHSWSERKMPTCERTCPPLYSSSTTILTCADKLGQPIECSQATEGSFLTFECAPYYEVPLGQRKTIFCLDGIWNYPKPECQPVCGKKIETKPLIHGGRVHYTLEYPWVVALYLRNKYGFSNICGGTIINKNMVLTAAHCVTNEYAEPLDSDLFRVAAAKLYNKYGDQRDTSAQYVEINKIIVHSQYKGESRRYLGDIALLITKTFFQLGNLVQPACINDLSSIYLYPGLIGETAGWGATEYGLPSEELRSIEIPYKSDTLCSNDLPPSWSEKYHLLDKMCAGSPQTNISVCKGDSGNGLFFKNVEDGRYYVHGIVSLAPFASGSPCNTLNSALYTKVSFYFSFIDAELSKINRCKLPPFPKNGKWTLESDLSKRPGNVVSLNEVLTFSCDPGYKLSRTNSSSDCEEATSHVPFCESTGTSSIVSSVEESTLSPLTPDEHALEIEEFLDNVDCGIKNNDTITTLPDNNTVIHSEYPWHVNIYKKRTFLGLGSLITKKLIVTTAYVACVKDTTTPLEARIVKVALGKYHKFYGDPRDVDAKYFEVSHVIVYDEYDGVKQGIYGDVGFMVTKTPVEFNQWIRPVCIKGLDKLQLHQGDKGTIYGFSNKVDKEVPEVTALELAYNVPNKCFQDTPHWLSYLSEDLICGSAPNKTAYNGDGGTGWWFKNPENGRYYIHAVLGLIYVKDKILVPGENNAYVSFKFHYDYIMGIVRRYG